MKKVKERLNCSDDRLDEILNKVLDVGYEDIDAIIGCQCCYQSITHLSEVFKLQICINHTKYETTIAKHANTRFVPLYAKIGVPKTMALHVVDAAGLS